MIRYFTDVDERILCKPDLVAKLRAQANQIQLPGIEARVPIPDIWFK